MTTNSFFTVEEFIARRERFFTQMPENSVAIFCANKEVTRSNDTEYPFCQNKNFYYLTGFNEPDSLLVLLKEKESEQAVIFCRDKDPLQEVWHGRRLGFEQAISALGVNESFSINDIDSKLPEYLNHKSQVLFCFTDPVLLSKVPTWLAKVKAGSRTGQKAPTTMIDCSDIISDLRLIKTSAELHVMRQVNIISGKAHRRAMEKTREGLFEYQIEAELLHEFARHGARHVAYNSIVAGGDNANILHYVDNSDELKDGDLLLIDAGGELSGYAADITRTFPVNGKFNAEQKALYLLVLKAQNAAIDAIKPQATFAELNQIVGEILTQGLYDLGILQGDIEQLIKDNACKKYFIHGLGHWLGLDVHDVGDYHANEHRQQCRPFKAGMVMTIEPGLYIPLNSDNDETMIDPKWRGIGIRIEDNILVTKNGYENLTINAPKTIAEIESAMKKQPISKSITPNRHTISHG